MTALKLVGLERKQVHPPAQTALRWTGTTCGDCASHRRRSGALHCLPTSPPATSIVTPATEVLEILKRLNEDFHKTIVMVTHDPAQGVVRARDPAPGKGNVAASVAGERGTAKTLLATFQEHVNKKPALSSTRDACKQAAFLQLRKRCARWQVARRCAGTGSDTHPHARRPFSRTTLSASPYSTNRLSTKVSHRGQRIF